MNQPPAATTTPHPWIASLQANLDALQNALLQGDASGVEQASAAMQAVLQQAPRTSEFAAPGSTLRSDMHSAAQRFAQLRQAVLRASAQTQRGVDTLLPQIALQQPTYGRMAASRPLASGGASRGFLRA
ncbi:hypothetical protein [Hydrogenophaga sp.]|uniref:hypothetical protein n=1 Tax=Hydrogenophaga sp. TaxID=1904254 RepID=UPI0026158914|nr:hypothetical protein [Hydrogenophaga sp.]MCW5655624.1 hypothetical protein [Hydrogenophaga sp.]